MDAPRHVAKDTHGQTAAFTATCRLLWQGILPPGESLSGPIRGRQERSERKLHRGALVQGPLQHTAATAPEDGAGHQWSQRQVGRNHRPMGHGQSPYLLSFCYVL